MAQKRMAQHGLELEEIEVVGGTRGKRDLVPRGNLDSQGRKDGRGQGNAVATAHQNDQYVWLATPRQVSVAEGGKGGSSGVGFLGPHSLKRMVNHGSTNSAHSYSVGRTNNTWSEWVVRTFDVQTFPKSVGRAS